MKVYDDVPRKVVRALKSKDSTSFEQVLHVADYRELISGFRKRGIDPEKVYAIPFVMTEELCKLFSEPTPMKRLYTPESIRRTSVPCTSGRNRTRTR